MHHCRNYIVDIAVLTVSLIEVAHEIQDICTPGTRRSSDKRIVGVAAPYKGSGIKAAAQTGEKPNSGDMLTFQARKYVPVALPN